MPMCWTWWSRASAWAAERACLPTALKACIAQAFFFAGSQHRAQHSQQVVPDAAAPGPGVDLGGGDAVGLADVVALALAGGAGHGLVLQQHGGLAVRGAGAPVHGGGAHAGHPPLP